MNSEKARLAMVAQQVRTWDVSDQRVLDALTTVPREAFAPPEYQTFAYTDMAIPLADGQEMMVPKVAARILQALSLGAEDYVLEVGTGSGYLTALLATLARDVVSVEISPALHRQARAALIGQKTANIQLVQGDATGGWKQGAPFDVIVITGSMPSLPFQLQQQLKENGRLFVVVGSEPVMEGYLITRTGPGNWRQDILFETILPPLRQSTQTADKFVLQHMESAYILYPLALGAAILAGFINTLAGSGSLISLPMLIFMGLPPGIANGTNRIGILIQSMVGVGEFHRRSQLPWHNGKFFILPTTLGAMVGAFIATGLDARQMNMAIAVVMAVMLVLILVQPEKWLRENTTLADNYKNIGNFLLFFLIGIYGGFIQAGVGILLLMAMVLGCGFAIANANAVKLVLVLIFTVPAVAIFIAYDQVHWPLAFIMAAGQGAGAWIAARFASGNKNAALWTRRLLIVMIVFSIVKLLTM